ncbi:acyl-CoA dehydrogenase family protein [Kitasatospora arboriphila]
MLTESRRGPALLGTLRGEPGAPATVAHWDGEAWELTGRKHDCSGAEALAWMAVPARTDEAVPRTGLFLVRGDSPGLEIDPVWDQLGLRASAGHDIVLDRVRVAPELAVRLTAPGRDTPEQQAAAGTARAWHDLALSAVHLGTARAAQDWLVRFLRQRTPANLTEPLATLPRYRSALGEIEAALIGAEEVLGAVAAAVDRGEPGAAARSAAAQLLAAAPPPPPSSRPSPSAAAPGSAAATRWSATCATSSAAGRTSRRTTPCWTRSPGPPWNAAVRAAPGSPERIRPTRPDADRDDLSGCRPPPAPRGAPARRRRTADGS